MQGQELELSDLEKRLEGWIGEKMPDARDVCVLNMRRSGAGFANVSLPFDLAWRENGKSRRQGMLFRGAGSADPVYPDFKLDQQYEIMSRLRETDVPVPRVYWREREAGVLGFPFYIMGRVEGAVPSEYPPYHAFGACVEATPEKRSRMWWGTIEAIAKIHRLDWKKLGLSFLGVPGGGTDPVDRELDYYDRYLEWVRGEPQPILRTALDWLRQNRYAPERIALCWGDARLPNTMFDENGDVAAVLDWDMAILGDPVSDLAFILELDQVLSEQIGVPRLEGFPSRQETVERYEELTGSKVEHLFYNAVFATLRTGIVLLSVEKNLIKKGIPLPGENPLLDTPCTRRLAELLELPAPGGPSPDAIRREDLSGTIQIHLTGPGGSDAYWIVDHGTLSRHDGTALHPDGTMTVAVDRWAAIVAGELDPFNAWTSGELHVTGADTLRILGELLKH